MKTQLPFSPPMRPLLRRLLLPAVVVCLQTSPALAHAHTSQTVLERTVTVQAEKQTIKTILSQLAKQANIRFVYSQQLVRADRKVSVRAQNEPLATVLDEIFAPLKIEYEINHDRIVLRVPTSTTYTNDFGSSDIASQAVPVTGRVVDAKGAGLPGVTVLVKGTTNGTSTGADGGFTIQAPENSVLVFSFVGYTKQELPVTGTASNLSVTLTESTQ
ncbi:MAG: SusC/RagA family TonB-linked outer membrane protein, partial [Hymenobacter sp.]